MSRTNIDSFVGEERTSVACRDFGYEHSELTTIFQISYVQDINTTKKPFAFYWCQ